MQRQTASMNGANLLTIRHVVTRLKEAGVTAAVFKGPASQHRAYGQFFVRASSDVDLLVRRSDFNAVRRTLEAGGHKLAPECRSLWWTNFLGEQHFKPTIPGLLTVDLHHKLQQPGCPAPRNVDAFMEDLDTVAVGTVAVPILSRVHVVLVTAINLVKALSHREPAGGYASDLAALLLKFDANEFDKLETAARAQGLRNTLHLALRSIRVLFGLVPPYAPSVGDDVLEEVSDVLFAELVMRPDTPGILWPKRRTLLWALCDRKSDYLGELARAATSEVARRIFEPRRPRVEALRVEQASASA
jgi:hypothetical protein